MKITQTTETTIRISRASCIDLAGSEDNRRTDNNKERLVESSAINKSLFVLAQCVDAINKKQSRIPYRESKMTRILRLGQNNGLTVMILNLAPTRAYHLDTVSSLNFASRTKKIEVCEVENDPVLRTMVKPLVAMSSIGGANISRQPLRPLTAAHNANMQETDKRKQGLKPVKAFSVYSDARKSPSRASSRPAQNQGIRRAEAHKRPAESMASRPSKMYRAADNTSKFRATEPAMTKASIEALIAQRIDEKLAEKALEDPTVAAPALSTELQKRLDELEQRINAHEDDERAEGYQFLHMGKQHIARGEDTSALRMYRLAVPYFPDNEKLKAKIHRLEDRIRAKKEAEVSEHPTAPLPVPPVPSSNLMAPLRADKRSAKPRATRKDESEDEDFAPVHDSEPDEAYASDSSFKYKKAVRKAKKITKKLPIFRDLDEAPQFSGPTSQPGEQTPRTAHLLKIINSRDVSRIKALKGVGAKKADAIVNCLIEMDDEEVYDLESLAMLKGVGGKTVENMRVGLSVGV